MKPNILIGNSFPLTLARRKLIIEPITFDLLMSILKNAQLYSFWGHENSLYSVNKFIGIDITPKQNRPVLKLSVNGLILYENTIFSECYIISPNYKEKRRPDIGEEISLNEIENWSILKITIEHN